MNKKRVLGLSLLIASIFSSFSNLTLTGNIIGYSASSYLSLISILSFVLGVVLILAVKYVVRREAHSAGESGGYHGVIYYNGERTNLNTTIENDRIYIGNHGRGISIHPDNLGKGSLRNIANETKNLLHKFSEQHATARRERMSNIKDITDYLL